MEKTFSGVTQVTDIQTPFQFDVATALCRGGRDYQEDALVTDFARGSDVGIAVLADGMGGHAAGDVASKIVVSEVFSELMFRRGNADALEREVTLALRDAALSANACLKHHVETYPETFGMGATLVATVIIKRNLYWLSIGDSPLFLYRDGCLIQLNEDHSMAPQIDYMVETGLIRPEDARDHPDRNVLTSVLFGEPIPRIDCPEEPIELEDGDLLIVASDGLQYLPNEEIKSVLALNRDANCANIADHLLARVEALDEPDLDNVSFSVIRISDADQLSGPVSAPSQITGLRCAG